MEIELTADRVQLWTDGIMLTLIPRSEAEKMVRAGEARVISSQAIERVEQQRFTRSSS